MRTCDVVIRYQRAMSVTQPRNTQLLYFLSIQTISQVLVQLINNSSAKHHYKFAAQLDIIYILCKMAIFSINVHLQDDIWAHDLTHLLIDVYF